LPARAAAARRPPVPTGGAAARAGGGRAWMSAPHPAIARRTAMGREIGSTEYTRSQRTRYRRVLRRNLDLFETFLDTAEFVDEGTVGVELEMNLARTDTMAPALLADLLLEDLDDEQYVHEIGRYNLEVNLPVTRPQGTGLRELEQELTEKIDPADAAARARGS